LLWDSICWHGSPTEGMSISSFERSRDCVVPVLLCTGATIQKDSVPCVWPYFTAVCFRLRLCLYKGVPPSLALRSWHIAKLEGWGPVASFTGHLDDDRWLCVQKTRMRKMHFLGGSGELSTSISW